MVRNQKWRTTILCLCFVLLSHEALHVSAVCTPKFDATFTKLDGVADVGPTTVSYSGEDQDGQVSIVSGIQYWTVPSTGTYTIEAIGASGVANSAHTGQTPGKGMRVRSDFSLTAGQVIKILVGQQGTSSESLNEGTGGSGGSFVALNDDTPLIVAGGGSGVPGEDFGAGVDATFTNRGPSTAGTDSDSDSYGGAGYSAGGSTALSFLSGGDGASPFVTTAAGGFGGGAESDGADGGGGGGYSGGDAANVGSDNAGKTGAGSYTSGTNTDHGLSTIGVGRVTILLHGI